jgi:hypothetical protein
MQKLNDLSRSLTPFDPDGTLIAVIEMSLMSWLVAGIVPGVERQPLKKLGIDEGVLLKLLHRWREEAEKAGHRIKRIAVAFEAGRDGFWLARWLRARRAWALLAVCQAELHEMGRSEETGLPAAEKGAGAGYEPVRSACRQGANPGGAWPLRRGSRRA